jgi:hypothetical protein
MSSIKQFYSENENSKNLFPKLAIARTENEFIALLNAHIVRLNELVNQQVENGNAMHLYKNKNDSLYSYFFPRLSIAQTNQAFGMLLNFTVDEMKFILDSIIAERVANEYIKILKDGCDEIYSLHAIDRIARQEMEADEESSEEFRQGMLEPETNVDDIINEHYDAVISFDKKSRRTHRTCDNTMEKTRKQVKILPDSLISDEETKSPKKPIGTEGKKKVKWQENNLKKRKLSKLRLQRQDKQQVVDRNRLYKSDDYDECEEAEYYDIYVSRKFTDDETEYQMDNAYEI